MWHDHDIDFARWLHPAMWHVARIVTVNFTKWQHPAMWYVALGWHAIEFARWQHPAMWHVSLEPWHWVRQVAAPCSVAGGSGMTCHWIRPNVRHIGILHLVSISTTSVDMWICTSLRNFIQIGPPSAEKMTSCRFSRWRISAILDFRDSIMGSLKSPGTTSYKSSIDTINLNCLVFEKIAFFLHFGDRQTDRQTSKQTNRQTNKWTAPTH